MALFDSREAFCKAFFHGKPCKEWKVKEHLCLCQQRVCRMTEVYLLAAWKTECRLYQNVFCGSTTTNIHAEECMQYDFFQQFPDAATDTVTLYLTYQPCHFCGGHQNMTSHNKSCTHLLLQLLERQPQLRLDIVCSNIYRAHYSEPAFFPCEQEAVAFRERVQLARQGIVLLKRHPRVTLRGFTPQDWKFLSEAVNLKVMQAITAEQWQMRLHLDNTIDNFLKEIN